MTTWRFGNITVQRVLEYEGPILPPEILFPTSTKEAIESYRNWMEPRLLDPETKQLMIAYHALVIRTPHHIILVDTCGGNDKPRPQKPRYHMKNWPFLERLAAVGVKPEDVDFVLFTHLHVDHVGWNTKLVDGKWVPTFPKAKYLLPRLEWEYWENQYKKPEFTDDPYYKDSILPVIEARQTKLIQTDYDLGEGLRLDPTPGHTPGHLCLIISGGGREAVISGDIMHHPVQCVEPDWSSCFCVDSEHSRRTRRAFLNRYTETNALIMPSHFTSPTVGRIIRFGNTWRFVFEGE